MEKNNSIAIKRLEAVQTAKEIGISKAAELFDFSRKTIGKWVKEYEQGGIEALANRSRKNQSQPNKMPESVLTDIINLKNSNPSYSARKLKEKLELDYSVTVINKKLREAELSGKNDKENGKGGKEKKLSPFSHIKIFVKKNVSISDNNNSIYSSDLPVYRIIAEDQVSKVQFVAYCYEKTELDLAVFVDYLLENLQQSGIKVSGITFFINEGYLADKNSIFEKIVKEKYKADICRVKESQGSRYNKFDLLYENLDNKSRITNDNILHYTFAYQIYFNYRKLSSYLKGDSTLKSEGKRFGKILNQTIHLIPPIITDRFIRQIDNIKIDQKFWKLSDIFKSDKEEVIEKAIKHLEKIGTLAGKSYKSSKAIEFFNSILSALEYTENIPFKILILQKKGIIYQRTGKWSKAENCYNQALTLSRKIKDRERMKKSYGLLGIQLYLAGDYVNAMKNYTKQLKLAREFGDKKEISTALLSLGVLHNELGNYKKSLKSYNEVIEICHETGEQLKQTKALGNIGVIFYKKGEQTKAMEYYSKAFDLSLKLDDKRQISRLSSNMGAIYEDMGDYIKAMECYHTLAEVSLELENTPWYLAALINIGNLYMNMGKYDKALSNFNRLSKTASEMGDDEKLSIALANTAEVYKAIGKQKKGEDYIDRAIELAQKIGSNYYLCSYFNLKAYLVLDRNKFTEAAKYNIKAHTIAVEIERNDLFFDIRICKLRINYQNRIKQNDDENYLIVAEQLRTMLDEVTDNSEKAALNYELYKFYRETTPKSLSRKSLIDRIEKYKKAAETIYSDLYQQTPKILYINRIEEMKKAEY